MLIAVLQYCSIAVIAAFVIHLASITTRCLTFPLPPPSKNFPIPFVISQIYRNFAAWWSAARRASNPYMHHPEMANIPVASPLPTNKKPSRNCKMRLHTANIRPDDMFLDKKIKNPLPSQILSVYLPANKKIVLCQDTLTHSAM